jgi:hypothetical protein
VRSDDGIVRARLRELTIIRRRFGYRRLLLLIRGEGMTLRTGTSKSGAVHRYYTCSTCARKGKTACKGRSIPMDKLDNLVTTHMTKRLFQPDRLVVILSSLASRRSEGPTR